MRKIIELDDVFYSTDYVYSFLPWLNDIEKRYTTCPGVIRNTVQAEVWEMKVEEMGDHYV